MAPPPLVRVVGVGGDCTFVCDSRARVRAREGRNARRYGVKPSCTDISVALSITSGANFSRA
jgi:hypothetical protein